MNLGSEAREGLKQFREAQVIETSKPLGFVAAQRGDAGNEGVRDELLHGLYTLGHRRGSQWRRQSVAAPALRPTFRGSRRCSSYRRRPPACPAGRGPTPEPGADYEERTPPPRFPGHTPLAPSPSPPLLSTLPGVLAFHPDRWGRRRSLLSPPDRKTLVTVRPGQPC